VRTSIRELVALGPLPDSAAASEDLVRLETYQELLEGIVPPVTDEEAEALLTLFGPDECFGLAWAVLHLIESAPGWPFEREALESENPWVQLLHERASRG
jgi:hypothetical protein